MPETSGINAGGGIQNVGSEFSHEVQYENFRANSKHNAIKLHIGEVVQGTIVDLISKNEVIVHLPIGTLSAELKGELIKGDTLFFLVEKTEPALILKIHSVSVKTDGKELSINEIIRILNLQTNPFTKTVIEFLKTKKNTILRNEVILLNNHFNKIKNILNTNLRFDKLLDILYLILKSNIKLSENIFSKIQPYFLDINFFIKDFSNLISLVSLLPENIGNELIEFLKILSDKNISVKEKFILLNVLKNNLSNKKTFYSLLNEISDFLKDKQLSSELKSLIISVNNLQSFLESQAINNFLFFNFQNQIYFILPYIHTNKIGFVKILFSSHSSKSDQEKKLHFSFEIITENLDEISVKGDSYKQQLNTSLYVKTNEIKDYLSKDLELLKQKLTEDSFLVRSLLVVNISDKDIIGLEDNKPSSNKGFSVVI